MSILGGVEKIHNNLNTYTTEDIKVFKFSMNEWSAIINDDDYSLLEPIRDWRALGKSPIIEIPAGALGVSGGSVAGFVYLPLLAVYQSSEYTVLGFQTIGGNVVCAASIACQGTNVIDFNIHTTNLPVISGNTVDGELLTIDGDELKTSGISISDLEDVIALPINIPIPAAELAPVAADLFEYFQAHNGVGYPLINVNGKLYEYSGWTTDDDIITLEYASTSVEEDYLYRIDHVDKIRKYRFIYTDGEFTRVDTDVSWYFGGELANGCPLWVVNSSSEASVITGTFGDMARFLNEYGVNKSMGIVYDGWYYLKIHTYSTDGNYRKIIFIRLYPITSNYNSGYSRTYRPTLYLYFTYDSSTGYTYDHYDDSYIIVESPKVLATDVNYSTPYIPAYDGSPATKKYVDDSVSGAISAGTTAPSNPTEGQIRYDTTNDVVKVYDGTNWNEVGKEYNAGEGIEIGTYDNYSAMRGPCPKGFHIPLTTEWGSLKDAGITLGARTSSTGGNMVDILKMPSPGYLRSSAGTKNGSTSYCYYVSSSSSYNSLYIYNRGNINTASSSEKTEGHVLRPFKDNAVIPDNSWTTLYDGSNVATGAGIFHNAALGLISISADGINWITIADKNLGATTVYNYGDALSQDNCGGFFQRGNNYMFPYTGATTTSSTQVDASNYGPGNYYSSSTFITRSASPYKWDSSDNPNLRGGETGVVAINNAINNSGVLSVNGKSGDISINSGEGIEISVDNVVNANIGEGLKIGTYNDYSAMRGPCEEGYHIPTRTEFTNIKNTLVTTLGLEDGIGTLKNYLKMAPSGSMTSTGGISRSGNNMEYWSCSAVSNTAVAIRLHLLASASDSTIKIDSMNKNYLYTIRPFKDEAVIPDDSWTTLYNGSSVATGAGVFYNSDKGLISISGDGINWTTIADKNLGAIVAYNNGDVLNDQNCGGYFMRGNNYMFMPDRHFIKSSTAIDASTYGPGNYYYSNVYIDTANWDTSMNSNLRGAVTGLIITDNTINNSGVLSVNGRTGYVKIKEYDAGSGINIKSYRDCSAMRGPCPEEFHIPSKGDWSNLFSTLTSMLSLSSDYTTAETYLKMPRAGLRYYPNGNTNEQNSNGYYWAATDYQQNSDTAYHSKITSSSLSPSLTSNKGYGYSIRPFKDNAVIPDNSWTTLYDGSSVAIGAGIFWNQSLGLISISGNGLVRYTIADKNLGATTVFNSGDTLSEVNCGKYYQRGNNYGFPWTGTITTSSTQVDASTYGPGNYYSSSTFINRSSSPYNWDSSNNDNLWGGITGVVTLENAIINTGVISVNGQTGNIIMSEPTVISGDSGTTYTIKVSNSTPASGTPNSTITFIV